MSYLPYLYLFAHSGVQHILCCVFVSFFFILLQASLDCPFLIAPSVFSNVYLLYSMTIYLNHHLPPKAFNKIYKVTPICKQIIFIFIT